MISSRPFPVIWVPCRAIGLDTVQLGSTLPCNWVENCHAIGFDIVVQLGWTLRCNWVGHCHAIGFNTAVQLGWTLNKEGDDEKTLIILMMIQIS